MVNVATILVESLIISSLYVLVAIGFTLIFGVASQLNLAHGINVVLGGMGVLFLMDLGLNFPAAIVGALSAAVAVNFVLYRLFVKAVEWRYDTIEIQALMVMIVTLMVYIMVEELTRILMGSQAHSIPAIIPGHTSILSISVQNNLILGFILSWVLIAGLFIMVTRTWTGQVLIAATMSRRGAELVGVDIDRLRLLTWILAGVLATVAGLFIGSFESVTYSMGRHPLIISFAIVVLGGLGSVKGSVIGGYIIGSMEVLVTNVVSTRLTGVAAFSVLIMIILIRPQGLFGRELTVGE